MRGDGGGEDASFSSFAGGGRGLRSEALGFKRGGAWMGRIAWFTDGVTGVGAVVGDPDNFSGT